MTLSWHPGWTGHIAGLPALDAPVHWRCAGEDTWLCLWVLPRSQQGIASRCKAASKLNEATEHWHTARVTLSREAAPTAPPDRRGRGHARCITVVWFD